MNIKARNKEIRNQYYKMQSEKKYLAEYIYSKIAERWHISTTTIEDIVHYRGYYKDK